MLKNFKWHFGGGLKHCIKNTNAVFVSVFAFLTSGETVAGLIELLIGKQYRFAVVKEELR